MLDLTCAPDPDGIEANGRLLGRLDQQRFLEGVAITERAVDLLIEEGLLAEEASLDQDVLAHYSSGPEVIEHFATRTRSSVPPDLAARLVEIDQPVVQRAGCVLRRLRVVAG